MQKIKVQLLEKIQNIITNRIENTEIAIASIKASRNNETKSSMGDKFETSRAMMQTELQKNELQLSKAKFLQNELSKINIYKKHEQINFGTLAITNHGKYFISIGIGKITLNSQTYYAISLASPIGKQLFNKTKGEEFTFQNKKIKLLDLY